MAQREQLAVRTVRGPSAPDGGVTEAGADGGAGAVPADGTEAADRGAAAMTGPAPVAAAPGLGSVAAGPGLGSVVERMRACGARWPAADGMAVFNRVYLTVTEQLAGRVAGGHFPDRRAAGTLGAVFAERYLAVAESDGDGPRPPACWRPLLQYRGHPGVRPLQFALAGVNAHIGHDLPLAVVDACRALGCAPPALEDEFERVGELLVLLEERVREDLMPGPDLLQVADPLTHLVSAWSLERARETAWSAARLLWGVRELPGLAAEFTERLDAGVGLVGRCLLTPCR